MSQRMSPTAHNWGADLIGDYPYQSTDLRMDIGRSAQGTFVRLAHLPSGRSRCQDGLRGERVADVAHKLVVLLFADSSLDAHTIHIDHGWSAQGMFIRIRHLPSGCTCSEADVPATQHAAVECRLLHAIAMEITTPGKPQDATDR